MKKRYFLESGEKFEEVSEKEYDASEGEEQVVTHTMHQNGVDQTCFIKNENLGC